MIPVAYGEGRLLISGRGVTDGVVFFKVLSPSLHIRIATIKKRNPNFSGAWLAIGNTIVWTRKIKDTSKMQTEFEPIPREFILERRQSYGSSVPRPATA